MKERENNNANRVILRFFMKFLFFVVLNLLIFNIKSFCCQDNPLHGLKELKNAKDLTDSEKRLLSHFIDHLIYETFFGYVLIGEKALSFDNIPSHKVYIMRWLKDYVSLQHFLNHSRNDLGREVFSKLDFSWSSNFFYFEDRERKDETILYLVNRALFEEVVEKNIEIFRRVLNMNVTATETLTLFSCDREIREIILKNPYLIGILLGYGEKNARLYEFMRKINKTHYLKVEVKKKRIDSLNIRTCVDFSSAQKAYHPPIKLPGFVGDPNEIETKKIIEGFKKSRQKLFSEFHCYPL